MKSSWKDAKFEKNQSELLAYRAQMSRMRNEKLAEARAMGVPAANNAHGGFLCSTQSEPKYRTDERS